MTSAPIQTQKQTSKNVVDKTFKASLTYRHCQLKSLQEKIRHKKSDIRVLKKEFNSSQSSLQNEISFIDFAHASSLFL